MRFAHWPFLLLLGLIPLLHRWWNARAKPAAVRLSIPFRVSGSAGRGHAITLGLQYAALALMIVALARPQNSFKMVQRTVQGIDIVMVLDFSQSMNIEDLGERSRMDVAKEMMERFIQGRQNDRIGFVAFSGEPLTLAPPTLDYGLVLKALRDAQIGILRDGTAIGDGLSVGINHLRKSTAKGRVIVLLTDGENNVGKVDPKTAGELAAGYGIKVYTIAVGREGRVRVPIRTKGIMGNTITNYQYFDNQLDPELLKLIASATQGKFYRASDESALQAVFQDIDRLEKTDVQSKEKMRFEEAFMTPLLAAVFLLVLSELYSRLWRRPLL